MKNKTLVIEYPADLHLSYKNVSFEDSEKANFLVGPTDYAMASKVVIRNTATGEEKVVKDRGIRDID